MSYRGYATRRHYWNAKIHALVELIGDGELLNKRLSEILEAPVPDDDDLSVKDLSDTQAKGLFNDLLGLYKKINDNEREADRILGTGKFMTDKQKGAIVKIAKYRFGWKPEATFSFILETCPEVRQRLSSYEIKRSSLKKLFLILRKKQADKVIKRLDQIKFRNEKALLA